MTRILPLLLLLVLGGCKASETARNGFDPATGRSTYSSPRILMDHVDLSGGLASNQRVMWRAMASCSGDGCTPNDVDLVFYNDADRGLNLDSRRVQIVFDGMTRDWEDLSRIEEPAAYSTPRGEFMRVSLSGLDFARMAEAREVEVILGMTGTTRLRVPHDRRNEFRALAAEIGL